MRGLRRTQFAFPKHQGCPPARRQLQNVRQVSAPVAFDLSGPVSRIGLGYFGAGGAVVPVPETSVNEDRQAPADECDVRLPGYVVPMQAVARVSEGSAHRPDAKLRLRVSTLHRTHRS